MTIAACVICRHAFHPRNRSQVTCGRRACSDARQARQRAAELRRRYTGQTVTCVMCGVTVPRHTARQVTCEAPACIDRNRQWHPGRRRHQRVSAPAPDVWARPIPPPIEPAIAVTPPRPVMLPDGTEAEVVWAGDMMTGAGCRGGLLPERRSAGDPVSRMAPDWSGVWLTTAQHREAATRSRARKRRQTGVAA